MVLTVDKMYRNVLLSGALSCLFGLIAENLKPHFGMLIKKGEDEICVFKFGPPFVIFCGYFSILLLVLSTACGNYAITYDYDNQHVPESRLFRRRSMFVFYGLSWFISGTAAAVLLIGTVEDQLSEKTISDYKESEDCMKAGYFGGGAFLSFGASLFWMICLTFANNEREDYVEELREANNNAQ